MTACTEPHQPQPTYGLAGEGQKGIAKEAPAMTACTEPHQPQPTYGLAGEGQKGIAKEAQP